MVMLYKYSMQNKTTPLINVYLIHLKYIMLTKKISYKGPNVPTKPLFLWILHWSLAAESIKISVLKITASTQRCALRVNEYKKADGGLLPYLKMPS